MTGFTYQESIAQIERLYHLPIIPASQVGLRRVQTLLQQLGDPQLAFRSIHIAGSTGKGSTTSMLASILRAGGFLTGCFRSPHLISYTERITIDGDEISAQAWTEVFERVWLVVERMCRNDLPQYDLGRPSFFDVLFAMMALYFAERGVEWAAIETGLGGRLDATNTLASDVAVVTNVSLEHTHILGNTIAAIAAEKAAIIKGGVSAVTASTDPDALAVIRRRTTEQGAALVEVGRDVRACLESEDLSGQQLVVRGEARILPVELKVIGDFQAVNAATAVAAAWCLQRYGVEVSDDAMQFGLAQTAIPGRLEIMRKYPLILLDGGHNPAACHELRASLERLLPDQTFVILFAAMADKDVVGMARVLAPMARSVLTTRAPGTERAADPHLIAEIFASENVAANSIPDASAALEVAIERAAEDEIPLLITGSLYLVGAARQALLVPSEVR